jgi:hypothetical protein
VCSSISIHLPQTLKRLPQEEFKKHSGGFGALTQSIRVSGDTSSFRFAGIDKTTFGPAPWSETNS